MSNRKYDPEAFRRLREHGATARGIALIYGMPRVGTVYSVLRDGWEPRSHKGAKDAETIAIWRAGIERGDTNATICEAAGVSIHGLRNCLRRWRLHRPVPPPVFDRKCRSCLTPIPSPKAERDGTRCIPCGRRRCRNGACECGFARYAGVLRCPRCGVSWGGAA